MDPDAFWSKSPREIEAIFNGVNERLTREHNNRAWLAWHIEALRRVERRLPKLSTLQLKRQPVVQSWQEQLAIARMWAALGKGRIHEGMKTDGRR